MKNSSRLKIYSPNWFVYFNKSNFVKLTKLTWGKTLERNLFDAVYVTIGNLVNISRFK